MRTMRGLLIVGGLMLLAGCAAAPCRTESAVNLWRFYTMEQRVDGAETPYVWKAEGVPLPLEACRDLVRVKSERGSLAPVGVIAWYHPPQNPRLWYGCLPDGYDPYERR